VIISLVVLILGLLLLPLALGLAANLAFTRGAWPLYRALGRLAPYVLGSGHGETLAFEGEAFALREEGKIAEAAALVKKRLLDPGVPAWDRNTAIDILISAGAYEAALGAEPPPFIPRSAREDQSLLLIQINLAEADYNVGRWDAAEARLRPLDVACSLSPITRAGLLQQRAWIAAHRGRGAEALDLCAAVKPRWLPLPYQAEYHFTRTTALLAEGRVEDAERALSEGESVARRLSTRRNGLFMHARVAASRRDWVKAEWFCRQAADHAFRGQGGPGLLLWAQALGKLGRRSEADDALRLVLQRDPESDAARSAVELLAAPDSPADTTQR
jgi:tetratricopeptide (TPR) repeat protein